LRQRREDIPGLCELFSLEVSRDLKLPARRIDRRGIEKLAKYDFPGNVRELRNLIERAMILSRSAEIGPDDFPIPTNETAMPHGNGDSGLLDAPEVVNLREYLENLEKRLILRALKASNGIQAEAARRLHLSRSDLAYKLAKYAIAAEALQ
jgi:DNA-binding NtrC family response regulator